MKRKIIFAIVGVLVVFGTLAGTKFWQISTLLAVVKGTAPPPESISSALARDEKWQDSLEAIGTIVAVQGVNMMPEVAGTVSEIAFQSGSVVARGDLLVRLDTSYEEAQLRAAEAQVNLAKINVDRAQKLRADNTVSQSEFDTADATWKQVQANADAIRAAIEKKTIRAPFAGRVGIRLVNLGEYLDTGKAIVSLQSLAPVNADFSIPQQELSRLKTGMRVRVSTDTYTNRPFEGILTAINPALDAATRNVRLQATLENADHLLRPGMFARIELLLPTEQDVLIVPATSVLSAPYGDSVYVIESSPATNGEPAKTIVRQQFVRTGRTRGDFVSVVSGLKPGQKVASAGLFKLRNGMTVVENNDIVPRASETPKPPDR
jgi:membrane fusion protein, multidrug efflux system